MYINTFPTVQKFFMSENVNMVYKLQQKESLYWTICQFSWQNYLSTMSICQWLQGHWVPFF